MQHVRVSQQFVSEDVAEIFFSLKGEDDLSQAEGPRPYSGPTCTRDDRRFPTSMQ